MLTNKFELPEPIYEAIKNDPYDAGDSDITVTQLINPPQIVELSRRHKDTLEVDAMDRLWATYGQLMHVLLERAVKNNPAMQERYLTENRVYTIIRDWKVSGQFDLYDKKENFLYDYKFVGAYAVKMALSEGKKEWEQQLNLLRYLFYKNTGILAKRIADIGVVRDFTKRSLKDGVRPVSVIELPAWEVWEVEQFLEERVCLHQAARKNSDVELPSCNDEERWLRNGINVRCAEWCDVRNVCSQYKQLEVLVNK